MNHSDAPAGLHRRDFLRLGLFGGALLAGGASLASLSGCASPDHPAAGYQRLRDGDIPLISALVPPLLKGAFEMTPTNIENAVRGLDQLLVSAADGAITELYKLLDALQLAPMRWYISGSWKSFESQTAEQLDATLAAWDQRDTALARPALRGLTQPLIWAWYLTPEGSRSTGYPGPPQKVVSA